jgi:hypothetical protein
LAIAHCTFFSHAEKTSEQYCIVLYYYSPTSTPQLILLLQYFRFCKAITGLLLVFAIDEAPSHTKHTAELFAMVRDNARIVDEVMCVSWVVTRP